RSDPARESLIQAARLFFAYASDDLDTYSAQALESAAGIDRIRIIHRRNDTLNSCGDNRFRAGPRASGVIARFESNVKRRATRLLTGRFQRDDFRMVAPFVLMKTFANNLAFAHD